MQKMEYIYFLASDMKDRLRVSAQKEKKKILDLKRFWRKYRETYEREMKK